MQTFETQKGAFTGHLSLPGTARGPGILLLHAWWGLNPAMVRISDMLAAAGFVTLAPDYYGGQVAKSIDEALACRRTVDRKETNKLVALALDALSAQPHLTGRGLGVIGFSLGCGFALEAARSRSRMVKAVVLFYGTGGGKFDKTQAAFLGHFAEHDRWGDDPARANKLAERIRAAGRKATFYAYAGAEHWFAEPDRPEYDQAAAELAWARTIDFLRTELG